MYSNTAHSKVFIQINSSFTLRDVCEYACANIILMVEQWILDEDFFSLRLALRKFTICVFSRFFFLLNTQQSWFISLHTIKKNKKPWQCSKWEYSIESDRRRRDRKRYRQHTEISKRIKIEYAIKFPTVSNIRIWNAKTFIHIALRYIIG